MRLLSKNSHCLLSSIPLRSYEQGLRRERREAAISSELFPHRFPALSAVTISGFIFAGDILLVSG